MKRNDIADSLVLIDVLLSHRYNFKNDIWALGCVLYEMLTLRRTFQASVSTVLLLNEKVDKF